MPRASILVLGLCLLVLFIGATYAYGQVTVEFIYWDPHSYCASCPSLLRLYQDFLDKNRTMNSICKDYSGKATFKWIDIMSQEGLEKKQQYNITISPLYAIAIDGRIVSIGDDFNETYLRQAIDAALNDTAPPTAPSKPLMPALTTAFLFGFFGTFSPCLVAILAFALSYTVGKTAHLKDGILQVVVFGTGFLFAAVSMGLIVGLALLSIQGIQTALVLAVCIFAIFFALNLLGLFKNPLETKLTVRKLARRYASSLTGLVLLGFLFYFLDPCLAPIFIAVLPLLSPQVMPLVLLFFCLGAIIPFFLIGALTSSISKLARITYRHKAWIRRISGLILLAYAVYIIVLYLV